MSDETGKTKATARTRPDPMIVGEFHGLAYWDGGDIDTIESCVITATGMTFALVGDPPYHCALGRTPESNNTFKGTWRCPSGSGTIEGAIDDLPDVGIQFVVVWQESGHDTLGIIKLSPVVHLSD